MPHVRFHSTALDSIRSLVRFRLASVSRLSVSPERVDSSRGHGLLEGHGFVGHLDGAPRARAVLGPVPRPELRAVRLEPRRVHGDAGGLRAAVRSGAGLGEVLLMVILREVIGGPVARTVDLGGDVAVASRGGEGRRNRTWRSPWPSRTAPWCRSRCPSDTGCPSRCPGGCPGWDRGRSSAWRGGPRRR